MDLRISIGAIRRQNNKIGTENFAISQKYSNFADAKKNIHSSFIFHHEKIDTLDDDGRDRHYYGSTDTVRRHA